MPINTQGLLRANLPTNIFKFGVKKGGPITGAASAERLCVLDELPGNRFSCIRGHGVALRNRGGGGRGANNPPYSAFGTGLTGRCGGANRCLSHDDVPFLSGLMEKNQKGAKAFI